MMRRAALLLLGLHCAAAVGGREHRAQFKAWLQKFADEYKGNDVEKLFNTWMQNKEIVDAINAEQRSWVAELGRFAGYTEEEFVDKILIPEAAPVKRSGKTLGAPSAANAPAEFDWREHGAVTSVKDQGSVGSCWAFSTVGNVEGVWALAGHPLESLSAEYLVDCDGTHDDKHADCSVFGGWPYLAYQFLIESGGVPSETAYPYCAGTGDCYPCMNGPISLCGPPPYYCNETITEECGTHPVTAVISSWTDVSTDENEIKGVLYETGPLSVLLDAAQLQFYKSGIWTGGSGSKWVQCSKENLNHAVLLVGYGQEDGTDYWTVKNSWGSKWGEDGYFRILRGAGTCGINTAVTTSII